MKLLSPNSRLRLGTWNVCIMYEQGRCAQIVKEMERCNLRFSDLWITADNNWRDHSTLRKPNDDDPHVKGVGRILSRVAADSLMEWEPVSERIITARFASKCQNMSVIQVYTPTNVAADEEKETFYHQLQTVYNKTPRDVTLVIEDFNIKIGSNNADMETVMGCMDWEASTRTVKSLLTSVSAMT